ncbi:MAG: energy-coupling factor transporter transmembrane component T [Coriobacteriia bacterium]|nr:energy-coupling factor transporter transmembrane component T [Coriobacteriia bacterium]
MLCVLRGIDARAKLAFLVVFMVATLHARSGASLGLCLAIAVLLALAVRLRAGDVRAVLLPLAPILVFTVLFQVLTLQQGTVLVQVGGFAITQEALYEAGRMLVCLLALMLTSVSFMRCTTVEELISTLRWLLTPLRAVGVRVDAFILSLSVALGFLPVLVREFRALRTAQLARLASFDGTVRERLRAYMNLFAPLLRSSFTHADGLADAVLARGFSCGPVPTQLHTQRLGFSGVACVLAAVVLAAGVVVIG